VEFPFHPNWRTDACHFAYYELSATVDHEAPVSRGGADDSSNWITTSMARNSAKANFTLEELGWKVHPRGDIAEWDGLMHWFKTEVAKDPSLEALPYLRPWVLAIRSLNPDSVRAR
jgi:hypothetical protein